MIYQVKLDMTGKILEVYYSSEKTMMKSSIVPALNCFKHVRRDNKTKERN